METKTYIWLGVVVGGVAGGLLGSALDHGNALGLWTLLLSSVGSVVGIWAGYKMSQD